VVFELSFRVLLGLELIPWRKNGLKLTKKKQNQNENKKVKNEVLEF
jgi:hypothetical protein